MSGTSSRVVVHWRGREAKDRMRKGTRKGLRAAAEYLKSLSDALVPLEEGTLLRSSKVTVRDDAAAVSYDTVYARRQHEELTWRHDPGRQAKYLEEPFLANQDAMQAIVAKHQRSAIEEGS